MGRSPSCGADPGQQHSLVKFGDQVDPSTSRAWADHPGLRSSRDLPRALQRKEPTRCAPQGCFKTAAVHWLTVSTKWIPPQADSWKIPKGWDPAWIPLELRRVRSLLQEITVLWLRGSTEQIPLQPDHKQIPPPESGWNPAGIPLSSAEPDWAAPGQQCCLPTRWQSADPFPADPEQIPWGRAGIRQGFPPPHSSAGQEQSVLPRDSGARGPAERIPPQADPEQIPQGWDPTGITRALQGAERAAPREECPPAPARSRSPPLQTDSPRPLPSRDHGRRAR